MDIVYEDRIELNKHCRHSYTCSQVTMRGDKIDITRSSGSQTADVRFTLDELDRIYASVQKMRAMREREHLIKTDE